MASLGLTFGSVGDIITLCSLFCKTVDALSTANGSSARFKLFQQELWNLHRALTSVQDLLRLEPNLPRRGDLEKILTDCHGCFNRFLERIEGFDCLRRGDDGKVSVRLLYRKLRWASNQKYCEGFRLEISSHISSISLILASSTANLVHCTGTSILRQLDRHAQTYMEKLQNAELISNEQHLNIELKISTALQWQETWARERGAQSASLDLAISPLPQILAVDFRRPNARSDRLDTASIRERTQEVHQVVGPSNASEDARIFLTSLIGLTIVLLSFGRRGLTNLTEVLEQLLVSYRIPSQVKGKVFCFSDARLRNFTVDAHFLSCTPEEHPMHYLIPSNLANRNLDAGFVQILTAHPYPDYGPQHIQTRHCVFEDDLGSAIDLQSMWDKDSLQGKTITMLLKQCACYRKVPECYHVARDTASWRSSDRVHTIGLIDHGGVEEGQSVLRYEPGYVYRAQWTYLQDFDQLSRKSPYKEVSMLRTKWITHNQPPDLKHWLERRNDEMCLITIGAPRSGIKLRGEGHSILYDVSWPICGLLRQHEQLCEGYHGLEVEPLRSSINL